MKKNGRLILTFAIVLAASSICAVATGRQTSREQEARNILEDAGVKGGLIVHLGCGDGRLTAALRAGDSYTVHGLEVDGAKVAAAREYIQARRMYGDVSVEQYARAVLPYADNLVNLVVVEPRGRVAMNELMRVVAPGGAVCFNNGGKWEKRVKPWPGDIDQWTHFLHDAGNNAVAADSVVGPP
ncbi:MAG: class I SAM-dependent methyltransferase, partial [Phycisphaerales bacterium]